MCYNGKLIAAAITHTSDMVQNNFFSHTGSDGSSASNRVFREGYQWSNVGENIAYGQTSVESVMNSVSNSDCKCLSAACFILSHYHGIYLVDEFSWTPSKHLE